MDKGVTNYTYKQIINYKEGKWGHVEDSLGCILRPGSHRGLSRKRKGGHAEICGKCILNARSSKCKSLRRYVVSLFNG